MGISRIDHPPKRTYGYYVRVRRYGHTTAKFFSDKAFNGKRAALRAAKVYNAELLEKAKSLPPMKARPSRRNTSGTVGVSRTTSGGGPVDYVYWQAAWTDQGKRKSVKFSVAEYGEDKARRLAVRARRAAEKAMRAAMLAAD